LSGLQKGFDKFALPTNGHAGKFLEAFFIRLFGPGVEPSGQQAELIGGNVPGLDAVEQMCKRRARKIAALDAGHG
jgi:hypothetical protein